MSANNQPAFDIPGIRIISTNGADLARFQGLLDGFQQNLPQPAVSKP